MIEKYDLSFLNLNPIEKLLYKIQCTEHGLLTKGKSSYNFGMPLLMYPEFKCLSIIIEKYIEQYCKKYNIPKLQFINSWFNITEPGNKLKPHNHGGVEDSVLSGALYVDCGEKSVPLIFPETSIKPYPGLLIIFPSDFVHYTKKEKEKRIVISFNTNYL